MRPTSYSSARTLNNRRKSAADERDERLGEVFTVTKGLFNRSNQLIHTSHNVTVNSKNTAERACTALTNANKQLERTKRCIENEALTPKALRRASASIVQRVGRSEPCIDAFQRIFPPEEIGGAIVWSPDAASRNLRTTLPYKIKHQSLLYDHSVKQMYNGSPSRTSTHFYNTYASYVPPRSATSSNRRIINLHQDMAQRAVLDHVEINRSLVGHLVEAKEEVRHDLSQRGDYCDYYTAQEIANEDHALIGNPVRRLDQLDHVINNITSDDVLSFINDENANAIFQNAVVAESSKTLSPIRRQSYRRLSANSYTSNYKQQNTKMDTTPPITSQYSSVSIDKVRPPASTTYFTGKGRTEVFANSLARASESPKRKSRPVVEHTTDEHMPQLGASQMLLSAIAGSSGNPLDDAFQPGSDEGDNVDPELLAFNYAAQHVKTAAEKYYSIQSNPTSSIIEQSTLYNAPSQQVYIMDPEDGIESDKFSECDVSICKESENDSYSSTEGFQIVPSKSMDVMTSTATLSNTVSLEPNKQLSHQSKSADSLILRTTNSLQKRSSVKQQGKNPTPQQEGEKTKRTVKTTKKRPTTRQQKSSKGTGTRQRKVTPTSAPIRTQKQGHIALASNKNRESNETITGMLDRQKVTMLAEAPQKSSSRGTTPLYQREKKSVRTSTLNIANTTTVSSNINTPKKNTSLLEEMANNNIISQSHNSIEMKVAHTAAKELLLPTTFSLSSTPGSSLGIKSVVHDTPESMRLSIITQSLSSPGQAEKNNLYPVKIASLDSKTESIKKILIAQKNLANKTAESTSASQSSSVADRMRALTPDQRRSRLNSILEHRSSVTRASIDSINRLSLDMQIRGSVDAQQSDYTDVRREISALSDQDALFPYSRRSSTSRSKHITERLNTVIGAREERRSLDKFVDETEDTAIQDVFVQRDQILRTLKLDAKTRKTLRKMRAFLLLALIGNAMMSIGVDHTSRGSSRNKLYNFKRIYNRHRNLTHALDYDANIPAMKIRK